MKRNVQIKSLKSDQYAIEISEDTYSDLNSGKGRDPFDEIMSRLDQLLASLGVEAEQCNLPVSVQSSASEANLIRRTRTAMPDPRWVKRIIRARQVRFRYFSSDIFADPAWDMLLDLTLARAERRRVSVTSLCIASGVPTTTALRWIKLLELSGLVERVEDETDRRRTFVVLSDRGVDAISRFFEAIRTQVEVFA